MNPNHESKILAINLRVFVNIIQEVMERTRTNERRSLKNGTASPMIKETIHPPITIPIHVAHPTTV